MSCENSVTIVSVKVVNRYKIAYIEGGRIIMKKKSIVCLMTMAIFLGGCGSSSSAPASPAESSQTAQESQVQEGQASSSTDASEVMQETSSEATEESEAIAESSAAGNTSAVSDSAPVDADSWKIIQQYGYQEDRSDRGTVGQMSLLSYLLKEETLQDAGEYFTIDATFMKPITVPSDLKIGDTVTVTFNELTGETEELTYAQEGILSGKDGNEYYYNPDNDYSILNGDVVLYQDSDDRVDAPFYEGKLCISKDAVTGVALDPSPYETVSKDTFTTGGNWFNGVFFDENGVVMGMVYYGD